MRKLTSITIASIQQPKTISRHFRRGSAYAMVMGVAVLLTITGAAVLAAGRLQGRVLSQSNDGAEAAVLAEAAVELGSRAIDNDANWRTTYTNNVYTTPVALGRGTVSFKLVDQVDTNLSNNTTDDVRIYGIGRVGTAVRVYSVRLQASGGALDLLKTAAHAGGDVSTSGTVTFSGGNLSSNTKVTIGSAGFSGTAEAPSVTTNGFGTGLTVGVKTMPTSASIWTTYKAMATDIPYTSITSGILEKVVLSPATNPWNGASKTGNGTGVYHIRVPAGSQLTIRNCRIVACLLITLDTTAKLVTTSAMSWEPARTDYPTLLVNASSASTVTFGSVTTTLSELTNLTNFNPSGTPYPYPGGTTDASYLDGDTYTSQFKGFLHIMGTGFSTTFSNNFRVVGSVLVDDKAAYSGSAKVTYDSSLYTTPPVGYSGVSAMIPVSGTWRWETAP